MYKRRSKGLFDDLHWTGKEYKYVSARKRTLERIIPKLKNKRISKGGFLQLNLEETVDKQDYNLVTWRSPNVDSNFITSKVKDGNNKLFNTTSLLLAEGVSREIGEDKLKQEANELVQYFHKRFFKLNKIESQENELNQALKIIKKYGFEVAKFVVDYAFKKAPETNFKIAVFGGILQYAAKAVANWEIEQASIEKASESQNRAKFIANCSICKNTYGEVYWMKIGDEHNIINVMNCLHNENQHKDLENQHKIKITNSREDLKILFIGK